MPIKGTTLEIIITIKNTELTAPTKTNISHISGYKVLGMISQN